MHIIISPNLETGNRWLRRNTSDQHLRLDTPTVRRYLNGNGWRVVSTDTQIRGLTCSPGDCLFILPGGNENLIPFAMECWSEAGSPPIIRV